MPLEAVAGATGTPSRRRAAWSADRAGSGRGESGRPPGRPAMPFPPWRSCATPASAARCRRASSRASCASAEFALVSGIGFLIAYFYVADFFRQYAAALALAGFAAVTVFQSLGLYNMAALSAAHRQLPRLLMGWTATVGLLLAGVFFLKVAPDFSRAWLALWYVSGAVALVGLPRGRRGPDAAWSGAGPASRGAPSSTAPGPPARACCRRSTPIPTATSASAASSTIAASTGRAGPLPAMPISATSRR